MKFTRWLVALLLAGAPGCATVASPVGQGGIFTSVQWAGTATGAGESEDEPRSKDDKDGGRDRRDRGGSRVGRASCSNILGIVAIGDASIDTAARNAGVTRISTVDYESFNVLFLFSSFTTIVRGE